MNRHLVRIASAAATVGAMSLAGVGLAAADTPESALPVSASASDLDDETITDVAKTGATEKILPAGVMSLLQSVLGGAAGPLGGLVGGNGGPLGGLTGGLPGGGSGADTASDAVSSDSVTDAGSGTETAAGE